MLHNRLLVWYNKRKLDSLRYKDCLAIPVMYVELIIQRKDDEYEVYNSGQKH